MTLYLLIIRDIKLKTTTLERGAHQINHQKNIIEFSVKTRTGRTIYSKMANNKVNLSI
ncbi:unnamed protein product [Paramecium sonneborni]|uniref:Uncharacterized protein n=1 Tax=Paramecium sonneborni TaxID=65129 RepID=A0A8S1RTB1_9CILI|nr:unnamed protein product [Paramecium sonneborni]